MAWHAGLEVPKFNPRHTVQLVPANVADMSTFHGMRLTMGVYNTVNQPDVPYSDGMVHFKTSFTIPPKLESKQYPRRFIAALATPMNPSNGM